MNPVVKKIGIVAVTVAAFFAIYIYAKYDPEKSFFRKPPINDVY